MIDVVSLSIAIGAILVALTTHIKFSKCWGFEMITRSSKNTPPDTPIKNTLESTALLQPSDPIKIPEKPKIKNWL